MKKLTFILGLLGICASCSIERNANLNEGIQSEIIRNIIKSVNSGNADAYVEHLDEDFKAYLEGELKIDGKEAFRKNRANHLKRFPNIHSEIQHLVEIDNKVIMHDKLWLRGKDGKVNNIVEIFTFENEKIIRMDVIQPKDLFE